MASSEVKWLWMMTSMEEANDPYTTSYRLAIASDQPLLEDHFDLALRHLFRKVPSLRVCIGHRDGETWLREISNEEIDLEVLKDGKTFELLSHLQQYKFNKTRGPLWCVKVKPGEMESESDAEFKHVYDLFLGICHVVTDGTSNMRICGLLIQLLDAVVAGTPVDDGEQLDVYMSDEITKALIKEKLADLEADPDIHARIKAEYEAVQSMPSLLKATFKGLEEEEAQTRIISKDLDVDTTTSLLRRCRAEAVTFNSAFIALTNLALVDLLAEGGLVQESYRLRTEYVVNARRYWGGSNSQVLGCHILPLLPFCVETPQNAKENLWRYVKLINEELQVNFETAKPLTDEAMKLFVPDACLFEFELGITNMGDVTEALMEGGKHVQVIHLLRSVQLHTVPINGSQFIHTFRNKLTFSLVYNTSRVHPVTAQRYCDILFEYLCGSMLK